MDLVVIIQDSTAKLTFSHCCCLLFNYQCLLLISIRRKLCRSDFQTQNWVNLIKSRFARVDKFFFPIWYRWLPPSCACFIVQPLREKSKQSSFGGKTEPRCRVSVGKLCSLVSCEAIPVADLVLRDCSYSFLEVVGHPHGAQGGGDEKSCPSCHSGCILAHQQTARMRYLGSPVTSPAQKKWSQISRTAEQCTEEWRGSQRCDWGYVRGVFWRCSRTYSSRAVSQIEVSSVWAKRHETKLHPSSKPISSGSVMSTVSSLHLALTQPDSCIGRACAYLPMKGCINIPWKSLAC